MLRFILPLNNFVLISNLISLIDIALFTEPLVSGETGGIGVAVISERRINYDPFNYTEESTGNVETTLPPRSATAVLSNDFITAIKPL